jgi:hypothetical protein
MERVLKPEEAVMLQMVSRLFPELPLFLMTAVATHLVMSFAQTLMHYKLGHHPIGGKFFRNHINFHHTYYPEIISSHGRTSATKATIRPFSSFLCFW